jgi:hypothetical protein
MMSTSPVAPIALSLLAALFAPGENDRSERTNRHERDEGETIEIVVETKEKPDWLFPGLDHPRVQAFFRSGSSVGPSLFDEQEVRVRPLVRAGIIRVRGAENRAQRRAARRFARELIAGVRPALEACYVNALERTPTDAERLTFSVELSRGDRGPVRISAGTLGDVYGNACVHGVLEFADLRTPALAAEVEIPVWFWLQTERGPR